jgi:hypothetical protein
MNRHTVLGLTTAALLCAGVVFCVSTAPAQQNSLNEQLIQPEIVKLSLSVDGNRTDVVTHIYKPSTPGVTAFPVVIFSHGRPIDSNSPPYPREPHNGVASQLVASKRICGDCSGASGLWRDRRL